MILGFVEDASVELNRLVEEATRIICAEALAELTDRNWRAQLCAAYRQVMAMAAEGCLALNWSNSKVDGYQSRAALVIRSRPGSFSSSRVLAGIRRSDWSGKTGGTTPDPDPCSVTREKKKVMSLGKGVYELQSSSKNVWHKSRKFLSTTTQSWL